MRRSEKAEGGAGGLSSLVNRALDLLGIAGLMAVEAKQALGKKAEAMLWRTVLLLHLTLWISAGLFLLLLGSLQWLADRSELPAGAVYAGGGLFVAMAASLAFQSLRHRQRPS